jgi:hypothetical protein
MGRRACIPLLVADPFGDSKFHRSPVFLVSKIQEAISAAGKILLFPDSFGFYRFPDIHEF